ncbi:MAG: tetratricopeptide repeat protein [Cyclobacteriaceae bacterium]
MIRIFVIILFCWSPFYIFSQSKLDSLKKVDTDLLTPPLYAIHLIELGKQYAEAIPDSALIQVNRALQLLPELGNDSLMPEILNVKAMAYSYKGDYEQSTKYSFEALQLAIDYGNLKAKYDACSNLGIDFMYMEEYDHSQTYFMQAYETANAMQQDYRIAYALNNLGLISYYMEDPDSEIDYYRQALKLFEQIGNEAGYANTLINIGTVQTSLGEFASAERNFQTAAQVFEKIDYTLAFGNTLQSMAENDLAAGQNTRAAERAEQALELFINLDSQDDVAYTYEILRDIYKENGNYELALNYMVKFHELNNQLFNEEKSAQIQNLQLRYETTQKEAQIAKLSLENRLLRQTRQRTYLITTLVIVFVVAVVIILYLRLKRNKAEVVAQESQLEALEMRLLEVQQQNIKLNLEMDLESLNEKLYNPLTQREYEILILAMQGKSNREISEESFVSVSTVKFHLGNVYNKIGVSNKKEAAQYVEKKL